MTEDRILYSFASIAKVDGGFLRYAGDRINKAETLGAYFGLITFEDILRESDVILWIDNAAAEGCINKGYSPEPEMAALAGEIWLLADRLQIALWANRVPSSHNIADPLSRGNDQIAKELGWSFIAPKIAIPKGWRTRWHIPDSSVGVSAMGACPTDEKIR